MNSSKLNYFKHIDGIRFFAVFLVIFYHYFPIIKINGYLGVDIFFIISGYVITKQLEETKISIKEFYYRRLRRLAPSLLLLLVFVNLLYIFFLNPIYSFDLINYSYASLFFYTNIYAAYDINYFDQNTIIKPLIHLWSLGVEEQFYIFWPFIFLLNKKLRFYCIFAICIISILLSLFVITNYQINFYFPITRFWELGIGSLAYLIEKQYLKKKVSLVKSNFLIFFSICLLVLNLFFLDSIDSTFSIKIIPIFIATVILIIFGKYSNLSKLVFENFLSVFLGKISYILYLFHWPLLSWFYEYSIISSQSYIYKIYLLIFLIIISTIIYFIYENPIRQKLKKNFFYIFIISLITLISLFNLFKKEIIQNIYGETIFLIKNIMNFEESNKKIIYDNVNCFRAGKDNAIDYFLKNNCTIKTNNNKKTVFLIGDSFSATISKELRKQFKDYNFLQISMGYCVPTYNKNESNCLNTKKLITQTVIKNKPDLIIYYFNWKNASSSQWYDGNNFYQDLEEYLNNLIEFGANKIIVIGMNHLFDSNAGKIIIEDYLLKKKFISEFTDKRLLKSPFQIEEKLKSINFKKNISYFSLQDILCKNKIKNRAWSCQIWSNEFNEPLYFTYGHFSHNYSKKISNLIKNFYDNKM